MDPSASNPPNNMHVHVSFIKSSHFRYIVLSIVMLFIGFTIGYFLAFSQYGGEKSKDQVETITVVGTSSMDGSADKVEIAGYINTKNANQEVAIEENRIELDAFKKGLIAAGIPAASIIVIDSYGNFEPAGILPGQSRYSSSIDPDGPQVYSQVTDIRILLTKSEVDLAERTLNALASFTAYHRNGAAMYSLIDPEPYKQKVKEQAVKNARSEAEKIVGTNNMELGKLIGIKAVANKEENLGFEQTREIKITNSYEVTYEVKNKSFSLF